MIEKQDWIWHALPGHYICADRCIFRLTTEIGNYLISTVGEMIALTSKGEWEDIDAGRKYETIVFKITSRCKARNCRCLFPHHDGQELDTKGYNLRREAQKGHLAMCEKWSKK